MEKIISTAPSSVATSALRAIPFENIIGGPLEACVKAQRIAAQTTVDFIREVGLEDVPARKPDGTIVTAPRLDRYGNPVKDSKGNVIEDPVMEKKAVYVCFQFIQGGRLVRLNVPMLSIVPIPYTLRSTRLTLTSRPISRPKLVRQIKMPSQRQMSIKARTIAVTTIETPAVATRALAIGGTRAEVESTALATRATTPTTLCRPLSRVKKTR